MTQWLKKISLRELQLKANNYIHPDTHPAAIIIRNAAHRFVSDTKKTFWNAKERPSGAQSQINTHAAVALLHKTSDGKYNYEFKVGDYETIIFVFKEV